ncbi:MAG: hypothetical protein P1U42_01750 [Phycisphaerales bacterium]|nr:hypothetical protein [Phycisphaerales bacterium]
MSNHENQEGSSDAEKLNENNFPQLSEQDRDAVDRLIEDSLQSNEAISDREHSILGLLSLLNTPVVGESQRASRVDIIRVLASRIDNASESDDLQLSVQDQKALDEYIDAGYQVENVPHSVRDRAIRCDQIGNALTESQLSAESSDRLIDRTLATIQSHIDQELSSMEISESRRGGFSVRWSDLISVAAMLLLVGSIAMPIMSGVRSSSQQNMCYDNMHATANAFGLYAGSNRDMLPMATAGFGSTWMDVGSTPERSNSSNLFTLIRSGLAGLDDLACPSNPNALTGEADPDAWDWNSLNEISYSYRIMPPGGIRATSIQMPVRVVLLADRSPVILRAAKRQPVIPEENSPNHQGDGQHMLMLDGGAQWATSPIINRQDNIWLPRPIEQIIREARTRLGIIKGSELPDDLTDAFVGP